MEFLSTIISIIVGLFLIGLWVHVSEKNKKDSVKDNGSNQ